MRNSLLHIPLLGLRARLSLPGLNCQQHALQLGNLLLVCVVLLLLLLLLQNLLLLIVQHSVLHLLLPLDLLLPIWFSQKGAFVCEVVCDRSHTGRLCLIIEASARSIVPGCAAPTAVLLAFGWG